ncbi:6-phosphogluconolactonase [Blastococcus sp. PRF04-17]|uniref:6-phosphogluconolactonase n=1 Tax=Blastococcus sp. PRF04-17 TaxID=2933797 RepID=UPI001FF30A73|nr:6-phosphogluconolactonase [Blastococcus sp. PRF04-17]UOY03717.1 6-phosphogluconolactonase [Blastococcus sp. PRF04-17]
MADHVIEVLDDAAAVARRGKDIFVEVVQAAHARNREVHIALAGGSSPKALYRLLAAQPGAVDWARVHLFVSDDRVVPMSDDRSNSGMVRQELLSADGTQKAHWHPVNADESADPDSVAREYEELIRREVPHDDTGLPAFDLIMLGMGSDRHTASLFPGKPALDEEDRLVVASPPGVLPPPVERVTFTFPLINSARTVLALTTGADKAEAFADVREQLGQQPSKTHVPAARVRPRSGKVIWVVDRAAAGS